MDEEIELYKSNLENLSELEKAKYFFYTGNFYGKDVVLVKSGVGKVNVASCTQLLIDKFNISKIIFTGVAGSLNSSLNIYDVVISEDSVQHDVDGTALGMEKGQIVFENLREFKSDSQLKNLAYQIAKEEELNPFIGRILSGDQFIQNSKKSKELRDYFKGDCVDMETAAFAHVCEINKISYLAIRSISDKADNSAEVDFNEFLPIAAKNSYKLVKGLIKRL